MRPRFRPVTIDPVTGIISGIPTTIGTTTVTMWATAGGLTGTAAVPIHVGVEPGVSHGGTRFTRPHLRFDRDETLGRTDGGQQGLAMPWRRRC